MSEYNTKALVLRTNVNHSIRCSAADERLIADGLSDMLSDNSLSRDAVRRLVATLPATFFTDNGFDTPQQYSRLLWDALGTSDLKSPNSQPTVSNVTNVTNFNGSVQAQILQTGKNSKAKITQQTQQNQLYSQMMRRKLDEVSDAVRVEITNPDEQAQALAIVDEAKEAIESGDAKPSKLKKILGGLGKWANERVDAAVGSAMQVGLDYMTKGPGAQ